LLVQILTTTTRWCNFMPSRQPVSRCRSQVGTTLVATWQWVKRGDGPSDVIVWDCAIGVCMLAYARFSMLSVHHCAHWVSTVMRVSKHTAHVGA
jgi:hypothetical protein